MAPGSRRYNAVSLLAPSFPCLQGKLITCSCTKVFNYSTAKKKKKKGWGVGGWGDRAEVQKSQNTQTLPLHKEISRTIFHLHHHHHHHKDHYYRLAFKALTAVLWFFYSFCMKDTSDITYVLMSSS